MAKRTVGDPPKLVRKPLHGDAGSVQFERAEALKAELRDWMLRVSEVINNEAEDIEDLQNALNSGSAQVGLHTFFLMGA